ncbi:MAG: flagellar motor switch protein FliN [Planctomycetes bacterium]|nr:flagellar motor switch protein FliN [Planctomycetota bacterium]MBZ0153922.1 flagellar motor switch protein FliN [Planctomycetota bacterium]MCC7399745.1 flagellar motor switch protein FliN [Planctomycetota bacterium]
MSNPSDFGDAAFDAAKVAQAGAELAAAAVQPVAFGQLGLGTAGDNARNLDLLLDVDIPISVEVGRTQMTLDEVLKLVPGSVIALDKKAEEPVDLRVNGKLVARGEVVLVDDTYGLRITQIVDAAGRIESLR